MFIDILQQLLTPLQAAYRLLASTTTKVRA